MSFSIRNCSVRVSRAAVAHSRISGAAFIAVHQRRYDPVNEPVLPHVPLSIATATGAFTAAMQFSVEPDLEEVDVVLGLDFERVIRGSSVISYAELDVYMGDATHWDLPVAPPTMAFPSARNSAGGTPSLTTPISLSYSYPNHNLHESPRTPSNASTSANAMNVPGVLNPAGKDIVVSLLTGDVRQGSLLCPLTNDLSRADLEHALSLHGLHSDGMSSDDMRSVLVYHIVSGECANERLVEDRTACLLVSANFQSDVHITLACLDVLDGEGGHHLSQDRLFFVFKALGVETDFRPMKSRSQCYRKFRSIKKAMLESSRPMVGIFQNFERLCRANLVALATEHGLPFSRYLATAATLKDMVIAHIVKGDCYDTCQHYTHTSVPTGCRETVFEGTSTPISSQDSVIQWMRSNLNEFSPSVLKRILDILQMAYDPLSTERQLRKQLSSYLQSQTHNEISSDRNLNDRLQAVRQQWPSMVSSSLKERLLKDFQYATSEDALRSDVCASCSELCLSSELKEIKHTEIDMRIFNQPNRRIKPSQDETATGEIVDTEWLSTANTNIPLAHPVPGFPDALLDPAGVRFQPGESAAILRLCPSCFSESTHTRVPSLALANHNVLGSIPPELRELTVVEESLIAKCRAKCWVLHLKEDDSPIALPNAQRGLKGHVIVYPQPSTSLCQILPPTIEEAITPICVLFVGSSKPSDAWLRSKAKPLIVRREKVQRALEWLKANNPLYSDVILSHDRLKELPEHEPLPVHIEHVNAEQSNEGLTSRYDDYDLNEFPGPAVESIEPTFDNVVVTDVDAHATSTDLENAAMRHFKQKGRGYVEMSHDPTLVNEFANPALFPMIYPTLFPYGIGGFDQRKRSTPLSLKRLAKHMFSLADKRFQEHNSFLFTVFNIIQRREMLLHTALKVKRSSFPSVAQRIVDISPEAIHNVATRVARGDNVTYKTVEEQQVLKLLKEVNVVTAHVPGSSAAKVTRRNEVRSIMVERGLPKFYVTINPADVYNPLVRFLAGEDINMDSVLADETFNYWSQSMLVAKNPAVGARFFDIFMRSFVSALLKFDPTLQQLEGGIFGLVNSYYGCVEAQGRGTLHCHMLIWVEGGLNCDEIKTRVHEQGDQEFARRLIEFLDDTISTAVPESPLMDVDESQSPFRVHPCATRGIHSDLQSHYTFDDLSRHDVHRLVHRCQKHKHTATCYKYWKGPLSGEPRLCRFDLDENRTSPDSYFDSESGDLNLRRLDGMVNNFNETIIRAIRCNMDVKYIGSGPSAKAVIYYITDYITKTQLKSHVAFAALDIAIQKLGEYVPEETESVTRAKRLLQKCAYTMVGHQELSAPQVASYLLDIPDHYCSDRFIPFFWENAERYIDSQHFSPECHVNQSNLSESGTSAPDHRTQLPSSADHPELSIPNQADAVTEDATLSLSESGEPPTIPLDEETVTVTVGDNGSLQRKGDFIEDYRFRHEALQKVCLWDSVAQFSKCKYSAGSERQSQSSELDPEEAVLATHDRKVPTFKFKSEHPEHGIKLWQLSNRFNRKVPTVLGPTLPRRDNVATYSKYARIMLILFKPWRQHSDLKTDDQSWADALAEFKDNYMSTRLKRIVDNMQLLHECKDSRDDHFIQRRTRPSALAGGTLHESHSSNEQFMAESEVLQHLLKTDSANSRAKAAMSTDVRECLNACKTAGLFPHEFNHQQERSVANSTDITNEHGLTMEQCWKADYEGRNKEWKSAQIEKADQMAQSANQLQLSANTENWPSIQSTIDHSDAGTEDIANTNTRLPLLQPGLITDTAYRDVNIDSMIEKYTLNHQQAKAFRAVAKHSLEDKPTPLRMYIGGPGGTGKSRVIQALKDFFDSRNQSRRFRLSSYTGIAAKNISGMTLHTALSLNQRRKSGLSNKARSDLIKLWVGVDYLFIDEVSMIGSRLMLNIHEALVDAKNNNAPFGGINIIFAGDFAQLPPVADSKVYSHAATANVTTPQGMSTVFAKLLWLSIRTVVLLTEIMRQNSDEDATFVSLLSRLREGRCTDADYSLLNTRIMSNTNSTDIDLLTGHSPIVVATNECKDALNIEATTAYAAKHNLDLHWYYARDKWASRNICTDGLKEYLLDLPSSQTSQRLGKIPLAIGMPVMFTSNFDVENGVVNGCTGTLKSIRYTTDDDGHRHATSCVVQSDSITGGPLHSLSPGDAVALQDTISLRFKHPYSKKSCTVQRTQIPITPAFAMTTHKSQGQTLPSTIIDLQSCSGTEAPYVMVSRVRKLSDLLIVRPFEKRKIQCRQSQETRTETKRLRILKFETDLYHGSESEQEIARHELENINVPQSPICQINTRDSDSLQLSLQQCNVIQSAFDDLTREGLSIPQVLGKRSREA